MKLYIIRHGQTDWNIQGKIQGSRDIPLNKTGREQAERLAAEMAARPVTEIFTSTLKRARTTAQLIGMHQSAVIYETNDLKEVDFGKWEGLTWEEIESVYPEEYENWCQNPGETVPSCGETKGEIGERCRRAIEYMLRQAHGDIAVVSHGAVIVYLLEYLLREHPLEKEIIVENASITTVEHIPSTGEFLLQEMNDIEHLQ